MERSVQLIVAGGVALVAGLWIVELAASQSTWTLGVAVALAGTLALAVGIARDLTVAPFDRV